MTASFRRFAAALLAGLAFVLPARATSYSVDFTDLWWNPAEDGWGVNVIQQNETLFLTFFIYGADSAARWVVAPAMVPTTLPLPAGSVGFTGDIYQTTGPWFGIPFSPTSVTRIIVGNASIVFNSADTGTLSYTINGVPVVKAITRQVMRTTSVAGVYLGGMIATASQCQAASDNGVVDILGTTTVTQTATQASFRVDFYVGSSAAACTFVGPYAQKGRMATVSQGTFSCVVGTTASNAGTFTMTALDAQMNGFHASFTGKDQFCTYNGRFGGTRDQGG
jgi:hypothetical protein